MNYFCCFVFLFSIVNSSNHSNGKKPKGALLEVEFSGKVGYLLDEIPFYSLEDAKNYINEEVTDEQWRTRIEMQISATLYRQIFRVYYFSPLLQLTLPPKQVWDIKLDSKPFEEIVQGHIYISRSYSFYSVLVGRADTLNNTYPGFDKIGGKFQDHFVLPVDPEHLFQRYLIRKNHYYYVFCPN